MAACPGRLATVIADHRADWCNRPGRRASHPLDASDGAASSAAAGHRLAPPRSSRRSRPGRPSDGGDLARSCGAEQAPHAIHPTRAARATRRSRADRADRASTPPLRVSHRSRLGVTRRHDSARRCRPVMDVATKGHSSAASDVGALQSHLLRRPAARQMSHAPAHLSHVSGQRPIAPAPGHPSHRHRGRHRQAETLASVAGAAGASPADAAAVAAASARVAGRPVTAGRLLRPREYTCPRCACRSRRPTPARAARHKRGIRSCRAARWRHIANTAYRPSHLSVATDS